jgi:hypothetical protein
VHFIEEVCIGANKCTRRADTRLTVGARFPFYHSGESAASL